MAIETTFIIESESLIQEIFLSLVEATAFDEARSNSIIRPPWPQI